MYGGELILRARIEDTEYEKITVSEAGVRLGSLGLCHESQVRGVKIGNYIKNNVRLHPAVHALYSSELEVNGICSKIRDDDGVFRRWMGRGDTGVLRAIPYLLQKEPDLMRSRKMGIALKDWSVDVHFIGEWLYACVTIRAQKLKKKVKLRLMFLIINALIVCSNDVEMLDVIVSAETYLVMDGCESCLRKVLLGAKVNSRYDYLYDFWESREEERHMTIVDEPYEWAISDHGGAKPTGIILEVLGEHDYLVLKTGVMNVTVRIIDQAREYEMIIKSAYFASLRDVADGYFHHLRSIIISNSDEGLIAWVDRQREKYGGDLVMALFRQCRNIAYLSDSGGPMKKICSHLTVWLMSGKAEKVIVNAVKRLRGEDMFRVMLCAM